MVIYICKPNCYNIVHNLVQAVQFVQLCTRLFISCTKLYKRLYSMYNVKMVKCKMPLRQVNCTIFCTKLYKLLLIVINLYKFLNHCTKSCTMFIKRLYNQCVLLCQTLNFEIVQHLNLNCTKFNRN